MFQEFVSYSAALELKKLGFNEECFSAYRNTDGEESLMGLNTWTNTGNGYYNMDPGYCTAPLYQQVFEWFRKKYLYHTISLHADGSINFLNCWIKDYRDNGGAIEIDVSYRGIDYNQAEIACIEKLIELFKSKL
jgi:hypothetical protein